MAGYDKHYEVSLFLDNALYSDYHLNKLRSSSDTSILCIPTVHSHSLGQRSFSYAVPAVWNTTKSSHPTPSHPSHHHLKLILFSSPTDCVRGGGGKESEGESEGEREKERELVVYRKMWELFFLAFSPPIILFHMIGLVLRKENIIIITFYLRWLFRFRVPLIDKSCLRENC